MKDIMKKLAELEATAPKVTKKKMLNEDSTTPPINVSNKPASLKDMFEMLSENIAPGQKPLAIMDPKNKQAGLGVVTSDNPSIQNILKNLDPKDVQVVMTQQQPMQQTTQPNQQQTGQPAQAGATGQPQAGQMQMKEKDEGKPGKNFAKIAKSAGERYGSKAAGERVAGAVRAKLAKQGKLEEEQLDEKFASQQQAKLMYAAADDKDVAKKTGVSQKVAKEFIKKSHGQKVSKLPKKVKEGDIPSTHGQDTMGAGLGAGRSRTTLEGKKPDFLDLDKDGNKKEPMKKAAADKKKQKVKESMNHRISAARLEGKSHGLRGHAHSGKRYEDIEEMRAYHEGFKEGMDELYEMGMYETAPAATVPGMADQEVEEGLKDNLKNVGMAAALGASALAAGGMAKGIHDYHKKDPAIGMSQADMDRERNGGFYNLPEDEMDEGNAFTAALAKTPKGGKFSVGGKTYTDRTNYDTKVDEYAFESLDKQLDALLTESEEVTEGLSVSVSKGQQNSPDSVTITAQDAEADQLLQLVKHAGLGLFGDDHDHAPSSAMSIQPAHGAPDEVGAGGVDVEVVDGNDGIMGLMQKLSGIQSAGADDYADEEGDEEQLYGNHEAADEKDCGCEDDCDCEEKTDEAMCNECGAYESMHEAGCSMGKGKEMVDEVETEDQMEFEVSEDNAPDSDEAETSADENAEAEEDKALALKSMNESSFFDLLDRLDQLAEGSGDKPKHPEHDKKDDKDFDDAEEEVTESAEEDEEDAIEESEELTEWANNAGKKGTDAAFEADIDFMTKIIAGGLNKPKSTGQTTVPVIAGQESRMHDHQGTVSDSIDDWTKLAGIK